MRHVLGKGGAKVIEKAARRHAGPWFTNDGKCTWCLISAALQCYLRNSTCGVRWIVAGTQHSPLQALAEDLCTVSFVCSHPNVVAWCPHNFSTRDVFLVVACRAKQGRTCPGSEPCTEIGPLRLERENRLTAAIERVKMETIYEAAEKRRR